MDRMLPKYRNISINSSGGLKLWITFAEIPVEPITFISLLISLLDFKGTETGYTNCYSAGKLYRSGIVPGSLSGALQ